MFPNVVLSSSCGNFDVSPYRYRLCVEITQTWYHYKNYFLIIEQKLSQYFLYVIHRGVGVKTKMGFKPWG